MSDRSLESGSTSSSLIRMLRAGDPDAWARLVRTYGPLVFNWTKRCGLQDDDAADVMQDAFSAVNRSIDDFDHSGSEATFHGWLWRITQNKVRDHFRQQEKHAPGVGGTDAHHRWQELPEQPPTEPQDLNEMRQRALEHVRAGFDETTWTAFWRFVIEQDDAREIAEDLRVTKWAVYKAKSRVLERLRNEFVDPVDGASGTFSSFL